MAVSSPALGTRHRRLAYLPGRQLCGPWQYRPPKPPSKRPIIIEGTTGTVATIGIVAIIGTPITVGTDGTGGTHGQRIIGSKLGRRSTLKTPRERNAAVASRACHTVVPQGRRRNGW